MKNALSVFKETFEAARKRIEQAPWFHEEWICKVGVWPDADWPDAGPPKGVSLKLLKRHWSNETRSTITDLSKIFFSIWTDGKSPNLLR
ncbi:MAG: hypothetical protein ABI615_10670, partial [Chthoniobacterales bacterium]